MRVRQGARKGEGYWKAKLEPEAYRVLRRRGTEPAFSGKLLREKRGGVFVCGACGNRLFDSAAKYDSGSGWPSFFEARKGAVRLKKDRDIGMERAEVVCGRCGSHLGHVFNDGPKPTGKRYCINSLSLGFVEKKGREAGKRGGML